jgi:cation diffusion facilitator family transporter
MELPALSAPARTKAVRAVLWIVLLSNWAVAAAKFVYGLYTHSTAMTADGLHSFIDGGSNVIGLIAMHYAGQPADEEHPYGHHKFEALAALAIGVMIGMAVIELGRLAFEAIIQNVHPEVGLPSLLVMIGSIAVNLAVTRFELRQGQKLKSTLLLADAQHTLSDAYVSGAVIVSLILSWFGVGRADGLVSLAVLGFVAWAGWSIIKQSAGILADTARLDPSKVREACAAIVEVRDVRDVRSRGMEGSVYLDLKIHVDPQLTIQSAHAVSDAVEQAISVAFPEVVDVVVHVEPAAAS